MFYRELTLWFDEMGIENVENIYTFYAFSNKVFYYVKDEDLYDEKIIESFYNEFVNKNICFAISGNDESCDSNIDRQYEKDTNANGYCITEMFGGSIFDPLSSIFIQDSAD